MLSHLDWAQENFGLCQLGDKRRTKRLIAVAEQVVANPSASLPDQLPKWTDLKAAYNLFDRERVTFDAVAGQHWELTKQRAPRRSLILGDTTELDFGSNCDVKGLGPTGNGSGKGFLLHNGLLVDAENKGVIGVAGQTIHYRPAKKKRRENSTARLKRKRESNVWGKVIDQVGAPAPGNQYIHVLDRGGDHFESYCHLKQQKSDWVVRAGRLNRRVLAGFDKREMVLQEYLEELDWVGSYELSLRTRPRQKARIAKLEVRIGIIHMPVPHHHSPWVRKLNPEPIPMHVVHVVEVNAPQGVKPIEWVLLTSLPVATFDDAWEVIEFYETRWLVEEYHKALKTGCRVESRQLKHAERLEPIVGLLSVVAVHLLRLKSLARASPNLPAKRFVPPVWLEMLKAASHSKIPKRTDLTVGQFYREVAKLGGFLARKGDGNPGWITIWRGWEKLNNYVHGATLAARCQR